MGLSGEELQDERIATLQKEVEEILHKQDLIFQWLDRHGDKLIRHDTILLGAQGNNGLKGDIDGIKAGFSRYRQQRREEDKAMHADLAKRFDALYDELRAAEERRRTQTRNAIVATFAGASAFTAVATLFLRITGTI